MGQRPSSEATPCKGGKKIIFRTTGLPQITPGLVATLSHLVDGKPACVVAQMQNRNRAAWDGGFSSAVVARLKGALDQLPGHDATPLQLRSTGLVAPYSGARRMQLPASGIDWVTLEFLCHFPFDGFLPTDKPFPHTDDGYGLLFGCREIAGMYWFMPPRHPPRETLDADNEPVTKKPKHLSLYEHFSTPVLAATILLHSATCEEHVQAFVARGALVQAVSPAGCTALAMACRPDSRAGGFSREAQVEVALALLQAGAEVSLSVNNEDPEENDDVEDSYVLAAARETLQRERRDRLRSIYTSQAELFFLGCMSNNNVALLALLLDWGLDLTGAQVRGTRLALWALHFAYQTDNTKLLTMLVGRGMEITASELESQNPDIVAAIRVGTELHELRMATQLAVFDVLPLDVAKIVVLYSRALV